MTNTPRVSGRTSAGLRRPEPQQRALPPRQGLDALIRNLRYLKPFARPRLPDNELACFDEQQRQIRPLPDQSIRDFLRKPRRGRRTTQPIPAQRRPHPLDRLEEVRRHARRRA